MTAPAANPFADHDLVPSYEGWYEPAGRWSGGFEKQFLEE
jgi:hypothetical protein